MTSLAALKRRLRVGTRLLCVENTFRPVLNGTTRQITRVLGNQIVQRQDGADGDFWTRWPPAHCFSSLDADTFRFELLGASAHGQHFVTLRILPAAEAASS